MTSQKRNLLLLAIVGLAIACSDFAARSANAAIYTWLGTSDSDWTNTANWDANGVPVDTVAGGNLDQINSTDRIIINGPAPTVNVPTFSGGNAFSGATSNTPQVDLLGGAFTVSQAVWNNQGLVHRTGDWNSSVGDGNLGNGLAVYNFNMLGNQMSRDDNNDMTWTVEADGTLNITNPGSTLDFAYSSTRCVDFHLNGGSVTFSKAIGLDGYADNYFDFTAPGASVTADFGGSFTDIGAVDTAIGNNIHFISTNSQTIGSQDNGDGTFTVSVIPEPSTFALAAFGLLGLIGFGRRRKR
jgi:hypothetical protein